MYLDKLNPDLFGQFGSYGGYNPYTAGQQMGQQALQEGLQGQQKIAQREAQSAAASQQAMQQMKEQEAKGAQALMNIGLAVATGGLGGAGAAGEAAGAEAAGAGTLAESVPTVTESLLGNVPAESAMGEALNSTLNDAMQPWKWGVGKKPWEGQWNMGLNF